MSQLRGPAVGMFKLEFEPGKSLTHVNVLTAHPCEFYYLPEKKMVSVSEKDRLDIIAEARLRNVLIPFVWRHEDTVPYEECKREEMGKAYGWLRLAEAVETENGLTVPVDSWTPKTEQMIADKEVAYLSPLIFFNHPSTVDGVSRTQIYSVGLTNNPVLGNQQPLWAALEQSYVLALESHNQQSKGNEMDLLEFMVALARIFGISIPKEGERTQENVQTALEKAGMDKVNWGASVAELGNVACVQLGLDPLNTKPDALKAGLEALVKPGDGTPDRIPERLATALSVDPTDIDGAIRVAGKAGAADDLKERVVALEKKMKADLAEKVNATLKTALSQGKIQPNRKEYWQARLEKDFDGTMEVLKNDLGVTVAALSANLPAADPGESTPGVDPTFAAFCEAEKIGPEIQKIVLENGRK